MKKILGTLAILVVLSSCSPKDVLKNGTYFAISDTVDENGWQDFVTILVQDEKIVSAEWDGLNDDFNGSKRDAVSAGEYKIENSELSWSEQANIAQNYLLEIQKPELVVISNGKVDALSDVSMSTESFFALAKKALSNGVVEEGPYKDGNYTMASDPDEQNFAAVVTIIVRGGKIIGGSWDERNLDGVSKRQLVRDGQYVLPGENDWIKQVNLSMKKLVTLQNPSSIALNDDGTTDVVSGVSIKVDRFVSLALKILETAKK